MYCATGLVTCLPRNSRINKYVFVGASCADKLDGFFAEVAYKGKFVYKHTVDIFSVLVIVVDHFSKSFSSTDSNIRSNPLTLFSHLLHL